MKSMQKSLFQNKLINGIISSMIFLIIDYQYYKFSKMKAISKLNFCHVLSKKRIIFIFCVLYFIHYSIVFSQGNLPVDKYSNEYNFSNLKLDLENSRTYAIAYRLNSFTNYNYASNIQLGDINYKGGVELIVRRYKWTPLMLDYGGFYEKYISSDNSFTHYGGKIALSTILFPTPKVILPYGGVGLQLSEITSKLYSNTSGVNDEEVSGTSCLFWKVGIQSIIGNNFSVLFEYNQSFLLTNKTENQLILGIGLHF